MTAVPATNSGARRRSARFARIAGVVGIVLGLLLASWRTVGLHFRAARLLDQLGTGTSPFTPGVEETLVALDDGSRGRLYTPAGVANGAPRPRGIVLVHGIHRLGIDEPRLVRFARVLARERVTVMTPEISELVDYHIDPQSIDRIGRAAHWLRGAETRGRIPGAGATTTEGPPVGVMGMSFAGGLSLLAAADDRFAPDVAFVVAIGAHDDLARVARFFVTDQIAAPDGPPIRLAAHEYGLLVLVYQHVEDFFPPADFAAAHEVLKAWLWENRDDAHEKERHLSPDSRVKMDHLLSHQFADIAADVLSTVGRIEPSLAPVSPHGRLGGLRAPVFLLHGSGDQVIPSTETAWLAREVPRESLRSVLISPAIVHVEMDRGTSLVDRWRLVHFMASVLAETERAR